MEGCFLPENTLLRWNMHTKTKRNPYHVSKTFLEKRDNTSYALENNSYSGMMNRCYNINDPRYADYGGRGIVVCDSWKEGFLYFLEDMGKRPSREYTLERIDNSKSYSKENCKWATITEQNNNTRKSRLITYNNKTQSLSAWAKELGLSTAKVHYRWSWNIPLDKDLTKT
jgi:hypothetical protein